QAGGQVDQPADQPADQEEQLPQAHQGERVGGEDEVRLPGDAEDGRDRVHREHQVGGTDRDHHQQHRGDQPAAVLHGGQAALAVPGAHRQDPAAEPDHGVLLELRAVVVAADQLDAGVEQEQPEDVEDPDEGADQHRADRDEPGPHQQRQNDADHEHLLLVDPRYREPAHDQQEDEQVVHREAVLGEPPGV